MRNLTLSIFSLLGVLFLSGCASVSVRQGQATQISALPPTVYVDKFSMDEADLLVDRKGQELVDFEHGMQKIMQVAITTDLTNRLIDAKPYPKKALPPSRAWVIAGRYTRVEQGSRLLRGVIGFGLGATKLETRVRVYDWSTKPPTLLLSFSTTGGSNAEPGAVTSIATDPLTIAVQAVLGSAGNIAHGLTEDTKRTAREITAELSDYMYHNNLISKDQWIKPKIQNLKPDDIGRSRFLSFSLIEGKRTK